MCGALRRRNRCPFVSSEFPLIAGADLDDVEEAKQSLVRLLKRTLQLTPKADDAPVRWAR